MGERRTAWHYFLGRLLDDRAPRHFEVRGEEPLTKALQHIDWLVLRRKARPAVEDRGGTLVGLWPLLPAVSLAEFKSASRGYRARELDRLVGYGHQFFSARAEEVARRDELALVLIVAERNDALDADLAALGLREAPVAKGYSAIEGLAFQMVLVDLRVVVGTAPEDYVALFVPHSPVVPDAARWWYTHRGRRRDDEMDPSTLDDYDSFVQRLREVMPLEERLAGLTPEQRLAGMTPEEIAQSIATIPEPELVLALPDHLLRVLPDEYIATLPGDVQAKVRARSGH